MSDSAPPPVLLTAEGSVAAQSAEASASVSEESTSVAADTPAVDADGDTPLTTSAAGSDAPEAKAPRQPKRKFRKHLIIFGYVGTDFCGIQRNRGVHTIEDEMFAALKTAGYIEEIDVHKPNRMDWTRAARTDKGVHAAAQVVGLKLREPLNEDYEGVVNDLNALLPPSIRVFGVRRAVKSFSAQHAASGRQYEYLLPTHILRPITWEAPLATAPTMPALRPGETPPPVLPCPVAGDPFVHGTAASKARAEAGAACAAAGGPFSVFQALPAQPRDAAATAAPAVKLWAASQASLDKARSANDTRSSIPVDVVAASGGTAVPVAAGAAAADADGDVALAGTSTAAPTSSSASPVGGAKRPRDEGAADPRATAEAEGAAEAAADGAEAGVDKAVELNMAPVEVVHMTQGWAHDPAKYTYMAAVVWKGRRSRRATPQDLTPNTPRPGTAAYHNSHQAVHTDVTAVSTYRQGHANTDSAPPAAADDVFANGSAKAAAAAQAGAAREAAVAEQRAQRSAASTSAANSTPWRLDDRTLIRLRYAAQQMVGCNSFHNFTPKMGPGDAACKRTVRVVDVSDPFMVDGTEYVRITLRGQSFILNQIRHMVACMADYARGALAALHLRIIFSRNTKLIVPLAPATGLFLHNPEFDNYNRTQGEEHGPIIITEQEPVCSRVNAFKVDFIYPHMHKQIVQEQPFEEFAVECGHPRYYNHVYIDTNPESTHTSKTAMKDYTKRFFGRIAKEMGHGKAQATVTAMKRADKGAAKHLFSEAQKAAKRGRYSGKRKRW